MTRTTLAAALAASFAVSGAASAQELFEMTSGYANNLPILGTASVNFVDKINSISTEVEFEHFNPGELVPALEMLDATSNGSVDAAYSTSGYWQGKMNAAGLFAAVPFGPEPGEMLARM
ncbi:C4-dicarboxylate ABC transporter, partial [Salipiger sp. HF18]|nr:C4-dicarboxylate ABC transporter [Salipiger sp. HF18]